MSLNRIQKLLFSEYCDFEDMVLLECPFAQTTREGHGIRQVQLGLTPTKLVVAFDVLPTADDRNAFCCDVIDPEIETFELISLIPVECVNLSVYRRRKRQSLKAHFGNNVVKYFELGGFEKRNMFWNLWCERIKFLCPDEAESSKSETSVATSTSASTLNIVSSNAKIGENGKPQYWCKFGGGDGVKQQHRCKWLDKYLYMGSATEEPVLEKTTNCCRDNCSRFQNKRCERAEFIDKIGDLNNIYGKNRPPIIVNRFTTAQENNIFSSEKKYVINQSQISDTSTESTDIFSLYPTLSSNITQLSETAVKMWELSKRVEGTRTRHPRRYALAPQPHFLYGLGPWNIYSGERYSTQIKRSVSSVKIRRQLADPEFNLSISKRLLTASISCEAFHLDRTLNIDTCVSKLAVPGESLMLFWTPAYWYRPQQPRDNYLELLAHLTTVRRQISINDRIWNKDKPSETRLQRLRKKLQLQGAFTAWDFDSTTIAYQLVMIDKELFLKIRPAELQVIAWQRTARNSRNISSFIAFSHRVSNLIATEVLRESSEKMRARLIVRFINAADKCDRISSFQSCRSILGGLQSPPIYRLHTTWSYLRQHHAIKYQIFENLCRQYSDPRSLTFQKAFYKASINAPYLPYIGDVLARLFHEVPKLSQEMISKISDENTIDYDSLFKKEKKRSKKKNEKKPSKSRQSSATKISKSKLKKFLSNFKIWAKEPDMISEIAIENVKSEVNNKIEEEIIENLEYETCEDMRTRRLDEVTDFVEMCQKAAIKYAFSKNELARQFLLTARYKEECHNFYNSLHQT